MSDTPDTMWVKGYVNGFQVSFTLALPTENFADWLQLQFKVLQDAGVSPRELGTEAGEDVHTLAYVVRRSKVNDDGSETPIVDLYNDVFEFRVVGVYLNTTDDVRAFETATGLTLDSIPLFDSNAPLQRQDPKFTKRAVTVDSKPQFSVKKNARWDDSKTPTENKVPKHLFTRWLGAGAPAPVSSTPRTDTALASIDATRKPEYRPENVVSKGGKVTPFPSKQTAAPEQEQVFIATVLATIKTKTGKQMFVFKSPDGSQSASTFSLTDVGADKVYDEETMQALHTWGDRELEPVYIVYKQAGDYRNVVRIETVDPAFKDIEF